MVDQIEVAVWNEFIGERDSSRPESQLYPEGIHTVIAAALERELRNDARVSTATLQDPGQGFPGDRLEQIDVLVWWGHLGHAQVTDELAAAVQRRVREGMGFVALHAAYHSKPFMGLMGTSCNLQWREADDREIVWVVAPGHPIAAGLPAAIVLESDEMYGEYFDIPPPDELVFISSFAGGEVLRSGCCFMRGKGRIFYFSPGHETHPIYHHALIKRVIANAVRWAHNPSPASSSLQDTGRDVGWFRSL